VVAALEQAIGKPVITSTQATLWHALRLAGIRDSLPGYGRLLQEH
jgi:maleate isomerase